MIEATSIKKMFKAYTPLQMAKAMGTYKDEHGIECNILPRVQLDMWANGVIAIFAYDPLPKSLINYGTEESENLVMTMADVADNATIPAYPVLMGHTVDYAAMTDEQKELVQGNLDFIKFAIEDGDPVLFNPRYIVNLLNRAKSRKKDAKIEWFYNPGKQAIKLVANDNTVGILCGMKVLDGAMALLDDPAIFEWRFVNEEKDTPFLTVEEEKAFVEQETPANIPESTNTRLVFFVNAMKVVSPRIDLLRASDLGRFFDELERHDMVQDGYTWVENHPFVTDKVKARLPQALQEWQAAPAFDAPKGTMVFDVDTGEWCFPKATEQETPADVADAFSQENADAYNDVEETEPVIPGATMTDPSYLADVFENVETIIENDMADYPQEIVLDPIKVVDALVEAIDAYIENDDVEPPADDPFDVDGTEYDKAIAKAKKVHVTDKVVGGVVTETGLITIENVSKSKRAYDPSETALNAVFATLPEGTFYLGLWCTTTNKLPGQAHFDLAQAVWDDEGPGILVIAQDNIFGIGKDEESRTPDKLKILFKESR